MGYLTKQNQAASPLDRLTKTVHDNTRRRRNISAQNGSEAVVTQAENYVAQNAAQAPVDTAAQEATRQTPEGSADQTNIQAVADFAGTMEKSGSAAMTNFYNPTQNPADYIQAMNAYYNSGKKSPEAAFAAKTPASPLNLAQAECGVHCRAGGRTACGRNRLAAGRESGYNGFRNYFGF